MKPATSILVGDPLSGAEARFLSTLVADLDGVEALILANFQAADQQIDFLVVTETYAALVELKNFPRPIFGELNGKWSYLTQAGRRVPYPGRNPWHQAEKQKFALSDAMGRFQAANPSVPASSGVKFFADFDAFVCIYPTVHPESRVTPGNHRVRVASYPDVLEQLRFGAKASNWGLAEWRRFAAEHLHLHASSLEEATDPHVYAAADRVEAYCNRVSALMGTNLPPLISGAKDVPYGERLVETLSQPHNYLLLGPTGTAKTFHLHHLAVGLARSGGEIPVLVEGKRYRGGDFWTLVRQGTAQLFRGEPRELLDAIRLTGRKPVLLLDALNECPAAHLTALVGGAHAFAVQFDARLVATSQARVDLPGELEARMIELRPPDVQQKRLIYGYHASLPATAEIDTFCSGFQNAYDLSVAGRCHNAGNVAGSRSDLYDRYVRRCVSAHPAVALAVLRSVAGRMAEDFTMVWTRDLFETATERILAEHQASLEILDELRQSRLVELTDDHFSFEHELLFDYFRAEDLRRRESQVTSLAAQLIRPRNRDLLELVLPRFSDPHDVDALLSATRDASPVALALSGRCGRAAQNVVLAQCEQLLKAAGGDLPTLDADCESEDVDGSRRRFVGLRLSTGHSWTPYDEFLCHAIATNLGIPAIRWGFLELLDATEWTLRSAVHRAARVARFDPNGIWEEAVRLYSGAIYHGTMTLPCIEILSSIRRARMDHFGHPPALPIRDQLLERARRNPTSHLSLLTLLDHHEYGSSPEEIGISLDLVEKAFRSGIYILRVNGIDHLEWLRSAVDHSCPQEVPRIRTMLESLDTDNIMENTARVEALVAYGGLAEPIVSLDGARSEFRALIARTPEADAALAEIAKLSGKTPQAVLAEHAYGTVTRVFEDVFENVYWEAYDELSDPEKASVLCLAGMAPDIGFWSEWIVRELFRYGDERAVPVYERFASGIESNTVIVQEAVAAFVLGIYGWARSADAPPPYRMGDSPAHRAWRTIGECFFWMAKGNQRRATEVLETVAADLDDPVVLGMGDVLYQLSHSRWRLRDDHPSIDFAATFAEQWRPIVRRCVVKRSSLSSIFRYGGSMDRKVSAYLVQLLGRIGDETSTATLRTLVEDPDLGTEAIRALESIESMRFGDHANR
jgi:hypothetical protein